MTSHSIRVDDVTALQALLIKVDAVLLDFDGPICSVFAGLPATVVADQLRDVLADGGYESFPENVRITDDPFDVLHYSASLGSVEARYTEAALRAHELEAVHSATPTPGAHELIRLWGGSGRPIAVVSNNSTDAVRAYLDIHGLTGFVALVSARSGHDVKTLKPSPYLIEDAVRELGITTLGAAMVGDSVADIVASRRANVRCIGLANKIDKRAVFEELAPALICTSVTPILRAALSILNAVWCNSSRSGSMSV